MNVPRSLELFSSSETNNASDSEEQNSEVPLSSTGYCLKCHPQEKDVCLQCEVTYKGNSSRGLSSLQNTLYRRCDSTAMTSSERDRPRYNIEPEDKDNFSILCCPCRKILGLERPYDPADAIPSLKIPTHSNYSAFNSFDNDNEYCLIHGQRGPQRKKYPKCIHGRTIGELNSIPLGQCSSAKKYYPQNRLQDPEAKLSVHINSKRQFSKSNNQLYYLGSSTNNSPLVHMKQPYSKPEYFGHNCSVLKNDYISNVGMPVSEHRPLHSPNHNFFVPTDTCNSQRQCSHSKKYSNRSPNYGVPFTNSDCYVPPFPGSLEQDYERHNHPVQYGTHEDPPHTYYPQCHAPEKCSNCISTIGVCHQMAPSHHTPRTLYQQVTKRERHSTCKPSGSFSKSNESLLSTVVPTKLSTTFLNPESLTELTSVSPSKSGDLHHHPQQEIESSHLMEAEVMQQSSNINRLLDWNNTDSSSLPRQEDEKHPNLDLL